MALADATAWPHLSLEECEALLCARGQRLWWSPVSTTSRQARNAIDWR